MITDDEPREPAEEVLRRVRRVLDNGGLPVFDDWYRVLCIAEANLGKLKENICLPGCDCRDCWR
jgi:hypothetical protein